MSQGEDAPAPPGIEVEINGRRMRLVAWSDPRLRGVYMAAQDQGTMRYFRLEEATASVGAELICRLASAKAAESAEEVERRRRLKRARGMEPIDYRALHRPDGYDGPAVEPPDKQIIDAQGEKGAPYRTIDTLEAMLRRGTIDEEQHAAGERFRNDWTVARYDDLKAPSMLRLPGSGRQGEPTRMAVDARERVADAIEAAGGFGSLGGSCLWWVLGVGTTLGEWRERQSAGRVKIGRDNASGILSSALGALARHYWRLDQGRKPRRD
jgi:hypothetical protein